MNEDERKEFSKFLRYCENGNIEELRKLPLKYSKEFFVFSGNRVTSPLFEAIFKGRYEIVKYLLENGADPNYYGNYDYPYLGATPFLVAVDNGVLAYIPESRFWKTLEVLINSNLVDVNIPNSRGEKPLDWAVRFENNILTKILLERGQNTVKFI